MAISPLNILTKTSGALALASVALESNKIGVAQAIEESKAHEARLAVKNHIGAGKLNYESPKYDAVKETVYKHYPYALGNAWAGFKGYLKGFANGVINNIATVGFGALSLVAKHKPVKIISMTALAISVGLGFIKNGTNVLEKTDYLE